MSSKMKLKSNAGGSVSLVVDDTLATDEEVQVPSDGQWGIESGSNANGSYVKYPDGTLICHKETDLTVDITTAVGNLFRSGAIGGGDFPYPFIATPNMTASLSASATGFNFLGNLASKGSATRWTEKSAVAVSSQNARAITLCEYAIGRWK